MVAFPFVTFSDDRNPPTQMGLSGHPFPSNQAWMRAGDHPYLLVPGEEAELATLAGLVDRSLRSDHDGVVALGPGRLDETHNRQLDADRVIDAAIAMEAILSWRAEGEFSYREAVRGSHLLAGSGTSREATFKLLRAAYARRSKDCPW